MRGCLSFLTAPAGGPKCPSSLGVFVGVLWEVTVLTLVGGVFSNPCLDKVNWGGGVVTVLNCLRSPGEDPGVC